MEAVGKPGKPGKGDLNASVDVFIEIAKSELFLFYIGVNCLKTGASLDSI